MDIRMSQHLTAVHARMPFISTPNHEPIVSCGQDLFVALRVIACELTLKDGHHYKAMYTDNRPLARAVVAQRQPHSCLLLARVAELAHIVIAFDRGMVGQKIRTLAELGLR